MASELATVMHDMERSPQFLTPDFVHEGSSVVARKNPLIGGKQLYTFGSPELFGSTAL